MKRRDGFTLVELLVVIVIIALLAALLLPAIMKALCTGRQGSQRGLFEQLTTAAKMYETDNGGFPPSNAAFESHMLAKPLKRSTARQSSYFEFKPEMLDENENIMSVIHVDDPVKYRNCAVNSKTNQKDPDQHNKRGIDLWCMDCGKAEKGCNNWD